MLDNPAWLTAFQVLKTEEWEFKTSHHQVFSEHRLFSSSSSPKKRHRAPGLTLVCIPTLGTLCTIGFPLFPLMFLIEFSLSTDHVIVHVWHYLNIWYLSRTSLTSKQSTEMILPWIQRHQKYVLRIVKWDHYSTDAPLALRIPISTWEGLFLGNWCLRQRYKPHPSQGRLHASMIHTDWQGICFRAETVWSPYSILLLQWCSST